MHCKPHRVPECPQCIKGVNMATGTSSYRVPSIFEQIRDAWRAWRRRRRLLIEKRLDRELKPRLELINGRWLCCGRGSDDVLICGYGKTPAMAYRSWRAKRDLPPGTPLSVLHFPP
jgi:hypothetical protein